MNERTAARGTVHPNYTVRADTDWSLIPDYMIGGIRRYIENGIMPGDFLTAVLCNDLREAVGRADDININNLANYVRFFYNYTPHQCWGSHENVKAWIEREGLQWPERYDG